MAKRNKAAFWRQLNGRARRMLERQENMNVMMLRQYKLLEKVAEDVPAHLMTPAEYFPLNAELEKLHEALTALQKAQRVDREKYADLLLQAAARNGKAVVAH
ncbi:MAG TPA: hypothetical protein VI937_00135 [Negativicutes bacterium]|nr:hypothetical protein [Negativicutes bacterium]